PRSQVRRLTARLQNPCGLRSRAFGPPPGTHAGLLRGKTFGRPSSWGRIAKYVVCSLLAQVHPAASRQPPTHAAADVGSMPSGAAATEAGAGLRIARPPASPLGVLITIPALVIAVGLGILLLGRDATRSASSEIARRLLATHATSVQSDVAFALDQAG